MAEPASGVYLFDRRTDALAFGGSAVLALTLVAAVKLLWQSDAPFPELLFVVLIVCVDVGHVWATLFRVYLDPREYRRRPLTYAALPVFAFLIGCALYRQGPLLFWRAFAYLAAFHFVKQQVGFLALYRAREVVVRGQASSSATLDRAAIYAATAGALVYWHASLPRPFDWFVEGDFISGLPAVFAPLSLLCSATVLIAYAYAAVSRHRRGLGTGAKDVLVGSTAVCWWTGIVIFDDDLTFTATNVLIHGLPYMVLVYRYSRAHGDELGLSRRLLSRGPLAFLAVILGLAFLEESLWDQLVWHDHIALFGQGPNPGFASMLGTGDWPSLVVPLLAVPQRTPSLLDGLVWRRAAAPGLLGGAGQRRPGA